MFANLKKRKAELEAERRLLESTKAMIDLTNKEAKKVAKELDGLKKTIEAYRRQGAVLLLEDLDEGLLKKLQSLAEDKVIVIFCKDGTRIEIKTDSTNYTRLSGQIR